MKTGQGRLWPYDFSAIPVELISSIYEMFVHADDSTTARRRGTHYTPVNLVDLVLSEVFARLDSSGDILDMACGSGVFLVEALRKLVARQIAAGRPWSRELVRETLYDHLFGIDISSDAIQVTAFSLYLTALELDPNPEPLSELRFKPLVGRNLWAADAFDEDAPYVPALRTRHFSAIVGNPPWTTLGAKGRPVRYCRRRGHPISRASTDQAFLWRASDFSTPSTTIGLILHALPFFSHTKAATIARRTLLKRYPPDLIVNLADLRQDRLFPTSTAPALIYVARAAEQRSTEGSLTLVAPRHSEAFRRHGLIEVGADIVTRVSRALLEEHDHTLKLASWGSARDMELIHSLESHPRLNDLIRERRWTAGQGFQMAGGKTFSPSMHRMPWLASGKLEDFILLPSQLPKLPKVKMHRPRDPNIYRAPLVLTPRGLSQVRFRAALSMQDVAYTELYFGIAFPESDLEYARLLNAILNSTLATYYLFMTSSVWGVERDEIKPSDLLNLPVPRIDRSDRSALNEVLALERDLCRADHSRRLLQLPSLDESIYQLYGLHSFERTHVEDAVNVTIDLRMHREHSHAQRRPRMEELHRYAQHILLVLNPFFALSEQRMQAQVFETEGAAMQVVRIRMVPATEEPSVTTQVMDDVTSAAFSSLAATAVGNGRGAAAQRVLRIYGQQELFLLKPAQLQYWTASAGLTDADIILEEHMKGTT